MSDAQNWFFGDDNMLALLFSFINDLDSYEALSRVSKRLNTAAHRVPPEYRDELTRPVHYVFKIVESVVIDTSVDAAGRRHGHFRQYCTANRYSIECNYKHGRLHGQCVETLCGKTFRECGFYDGKLHGVCSISYADGEVRWFHFSHGLPVNTYAIISLYFDASLNCVKCGNQMYHSMMYMMETCYACSQN